MRLFGSYDITFDSTALGKTSGGVNINIHEKESIIETIGETIRESWITHVSGVIKRFNCEAMSVVDDLIRDATPGTLVLTGIDHKITITNAKLSYPNVFNVGTNSLVPFQLRFYAMYDTTIHSDTNPIFKMEALQ